jgi:hypothetical protein
LRVRFLPGVLNLISDKIGKDFSIEQIIAMDNGQALPVLFFGGGLGCQHYLEPNPFADIGIK